MTDEDKVEKVPKISAEDEIQESSKVSTKEKVSPNTERFNALMQKEGTEATAQGSEKLSLMETVRDLNYTTSPPGKVTNESLIEQTQTAIKRIEEIKQTLDSPNVHIKSSTQQLLHNKLEHIDDSLRVALSRAGVEYSPPVSETKQYIPPKGTGPIERFLGFLTDGQFKLESLSSELQVMSMSGQQLSPVNMLAVQVKVNQMQQELELFSALLSKGLESIKTIMNIQV